MKAEPWKDPNQKEWTASHPGGVKLTGRFLLNAYVQHFEAPMREKKRHLFGGRKRVPPGVNHPKGNKAVQPAIATAQGSDALEDNNGDKQWSDSMLKALVACSQRAELVVGEPNSSDFSTALLDEWKKIYPESTFTARNLKSRLMIYNQTRAELPPPAKRTRSDDGEEAEETEEAGDQGSTQSEEIQSSVSLDSELQSTTLADVEDEFAPSKSPAANSDPEASKVCQKHVLHMFKDPDDSIACILTEQMLQIRNDLRSSFPGCDLFYPKKPKGFSGLMLKTWRSHYPNSDENIKSVTVKFLKYDTAAFATRKFAEPFKDSVWTDEMLQDIKKSRDYAEQKCGAGATSHMITRHWKKAWKAIYPKLDLDWKSIVHQYQTHYGGGYSMQTENSNSSRVGGVNGDKTSFLEDPDEKVKGFRHWTSKTKQDLLETKRRVMEEYPDLEPGCSEFNRLLLQQFTKVHPKCMESTRSIFSKVQSIEKEEANNVQFPIADSNSHQVQFYSRNGSTSLSPTNGAEAYPSALFSDRLSESTFENDADLKISPNGKGWKGSGERTGSNDKENEMDSQSNARLVANEGMDLDYEDQGRPEDQAVAGKLDSAPGIEGFEGWTLRMIRDFIACMDTARRKYAILKENDQDGSIKLVPLLLEEWKRIHKDSVESVASFLVKIKHLKLQKDVIKKHLGQSGLLPKVDGLTSPPAPASKATTTKPVPTQGVRSQSDEAFKWHKSMIRDVILSRKRALQLKNEGVASGRKVSFHLLWSSEFKRIYPNSTFTSNNLSVHFWSWRKQQQRLGKGDPLYDESLSLSDLSRPMSLSAASKIPLPSYWSAFDLSELLEIGRDVQERMRSSSTSKVVKSRGFPALLHSEWSRSRSNSHSESPKSLHQIFQNLVRRGGKIPKDEIAKAVAKTKWKIKYQKMLRQCIQVMNPESTDFVSSVIGHWRAAFPSAQVTDEDLFQRVKDICPQISSEIPSRQISRSSSADQNLHGTGDQVRAPNARGQMCWNKQTIRDLFLAHQVGLERRRHLLQTMAKKDVPHLSSLVLDEFLKLHPYCKLSPAILMAKCYCWKNAVNKGTLDVLLDDSMCALKYLESRPAELDACPAEIANLERLEARSSDISYRTWTKQMIESMLQARKKALLLKKDSAPVKKSASLLDIWYDEFKKLHPESNCTKRNLWRKYKWYLKKVNNSGSDLGSSIELANQHSMESHQTYQNIHIRKDVTIHIKTLMEEARIFLPPKLPKEAELKRAGFYKYTTATSVPGTSFPPGASVAIPVSSLAGKSAPSSPLILPPGAIFLPTSVGQLQGHSQVFINGKGRTGGNLLKIQAAEMQPASEGSSPPVQEKEALGAPQGECAEKSEVQEGKKDTIKLPGGATLVAVTDRNVEALLKPKPIEKPNVTITIGEKKLQGSSNESSPAHSPGPASTTVITTSGGGIKTSKTAITRQPIILPINVPKFTVPGAPISSTGFAQLSPIKIHATGQNNATLKQPLTFVSLSQANGVLPNLNQKAIITPIRVKTRLEEIGLSEAQFHGLLSIYDKARQEYIETLKRGYLAFFPYILGNLWRRKYPQQPVPGRKLTTVVDMYIDERSKNDAVTPEYLTKNPCQFRMSEQVLRQVLALYDECQKDLEEDEELERKKNEAEPGASGMDEAMIYAELCQRWPLRYPEMKLTNKQLVSIHQLLTHNPQRAEATPETAFTLADIWRMIEKYDSGDSLIYEEESARIDEEAMPEVESGTIYDPETLSMDQIQEWLIETQGVQSKLEVKRVESRRPRFVTKNVRLYWTKARILDLGMCRLRAIHQFRRFNRQQRHRTSILKLMISEWKRMYPKCTLKASQIAAKCAAELRAFKRAEKQDLDQVVQQWTQQCAEFSKNEDQNEVIEAGMNDGLLDDGLEEDGFFCDINGKPSNINRVASLRLVGNSSRNFHYDEDVLDYIREVQSLSKGNQAITWTPEVICDLMKARARARKRMRKLDKEVGENNTDMKRPKVDDMFLEEWQKLRPELDHFSIWTLWAYSRKYDNLKKQLISDHQQGYFKGSADSANGPKYKAVYFNDSLIPKFDLDIVECLDTLSDRVKDLLRTRQFAKIQDELEGSKYSLSYLWEEQWRVLYPKSRETGYELQRQLYFWESFEENLELLKPALIKMERDNSDDFESRFNATAVKNDLPPIPPRTSVYPELSKDAFNVVCRSRIPPKSNSRLPPEECLLYCHRDLFTEKRDHLDLPAIEVTAMETDDPNTEEFVVINTPKLKKEKTPVHVLRDIKDPLKCPTCDTKYNNVNNALYHIPLHQDIRRYQEKTPTTTPTLHHH
eukprot:TCALIF_00501-PA protein Name:"Protein of unknown function" AED:0.04 eAED:0.04 QI:0/0.6/0.33/0.83/0.8/0.66/6/209/2301